MFEVIIDKKNENQRVDKFVRKVLKNAPLSFIYKLFRKKDVKVNDKKIDIDYKLKENDVLKIYVSEQQLDDFKNKVNLKIVEFCHEIIYEDENILIINYRRLKPPFILIDKKRGALAPQQYYQMIIRLAGSRYILSVSLILKAL